MLPPSALNLMREEPSAQTDMRRKHPAANRRFPNPVVSTRVIVSIKIGGRLDGLCHRKLEIGQHLKFRPVSELTFLRQAFIELPQRRKKNATKWTLGRGAPFR